jgi:hypothetical protein
MPPKDLKGEFRPVIVFCVVAWMFPSSFDFSSFIFFSMAKHKEIKLDLAKQGEAAKVCVCCIYFL